MAKTYAQIQNQIATLQREADEIRRREAHDVIARIKEAIKVYGFTAADLGLGGARAGRRAAARGAGRAAKYRDGAGNEWGGRGPRPQWLRGALKAGARLEDFLVGAKAPAAKPAPAKGAKPKAAQKRGGKVKFRDGAGHAWSGMGPKPGWLKQALGAGKKLDDFRV